jgi:hypothetical protein
MESAAQSVVGNVVQLVSEECQLLSGVGAQLRVGKHSIRKNQASPFIGRRDLPTSTSNYYITTIKAFFKKKRTKKLKSCPLYLKKEETLD